MVTNNTIKVWRFEDAPTEYSNQSSNGGDEDWVILIPASMAGDWISWIDSPSFGENKTYKQENGDVLVISSHA